ncbi:unnamed protein product [Parajaminaea phylloscopi]
MKRRGSPDRQDTLSTANGTAKGSQAPSSDHHAATDGPADGDASYTRPYAVPLAQPGSLTDLRVHYEPFNEARLPDKHGNAGPRWWSWVHTTIDPQDLTELRGRWDVAKTATPARRLALRCLAEAGGSWLYSFAFHSSLYSVLWARTEIPGMGPPSPASTGTFLLFTAFLSLWFTLIIFGPVAGGAHFAPQVTLAATLLRLFPVWKAVVVMSSQSLGFWLGQLTAVVGQWDLFTFLKAIVDEASHGNKDTYFSGLPGFNGRAVVDLVVYRVLAGRSKWTFVFNEITVNFLIALILAASVDMSNPYTSPSAAAIPIAAGAGFNVVFFGLDGHSNHSSQWIAGFNCFILLGPDKRCFPVFSCITTAIVPGIGVALGFLFYAIFIADIRRPAASMFIQEVDAQVSAMAAKAARQQELRTKQRKLHSSSARRFSLRHRRSSPDLEGTDIEYEDSTSQQNTTTSLMRGSWHDLSREQGLAHSPISGDNVDMPPQAVPADAFARHGRVATSPRVRPSTSAPPRDKGPSYVIQESHEP